DNNVRQPATCNCTVFSSYKGTFCFYLACAKFLQRIKYSDWHSHRLAHILMLKSIQHRHLSTEIVSIEKGAKLPPNSELRKLCCFVDDTGLLRLQSRLVGCISLNEDQIAPIILPSRCSITKAIAQNEHIRALHAGTDRSLEFL